MARLQDRVALITGGASGIGAAIATAMVAEGAKVMLADLNEELLATSQATFGDACATTRVDVTSEDDCARMVAETIEHFGKLDIGVNSAGIGTFGQVAEADYAEWRKCVSICLDGVFLSTKHESAVMREQQSGVIINIASINARVPAVGMSAYCSAKAAVEMLTKCAAMELGPVGVRVCGIGPGLIDTPLTSFQKEFTPLRDAYVKTIPMGRPGTAEEVASVAVFLASDDARWVSGDTIFVDGAEMTNGYPNFLEVMSPEA